MSSVVDQSELGRKDLLKSSLFFICSKICLYITSNKCSDRVLSHTHTPQGVFHTSSQNEKFGVQTTAVLEHKNCSSFDAKIRNNGPSEHVPQKRAIHERPADVTRYY